MKESIDLAVEVNGRQLRLNVEWRPMLNGFTSCLAVGSSERALDVASIEEGLTREPACMDLTREMACMDIDNAGLISSQSPDSKTKLDGKTREQCECTTDGAPEGDCIGVDFLNQVAELWV